MRKIILLFLCTIFLVGCFKNAVADNSTIDWSDNLLFNDIYYKGENFENSKLLTDESIGEQIGEVKFTRAEVPYDPDYKDKNGDATILHKGTKLYEVKGYKRDFRIAAYSEGKWQLYEAYKNPKAKVGKDMMDIQHKVQYIGIQNNSDFDKESEFIKDAAKVKRITDMVLEAKYGEWGNSSESAAFFVVFHLNDGSTVKRAYFKDIRVLSHGLKLPKEFEDEI